MGRMLVVDDNTDLAVMLKQGLEFEGYHVQCLTKPARGQTWQEAFFAKVSEGIRGEPFEVVVLDIELHPCGDGRNLACAMALLPEPRPKIILVSGMPSPEGVPELLSAGTIQGFLQKPFTVEELRLIITKIVPATVITVAPRPDAHTAAH